jgi:NAD(P)-dependent dehydrogenase (short-subunit alcohol dehydrogenase family)
MDTGLQQKTVVVTGATANIRRAIAVDLAAEGARLAAVGRDTAAGERLVHDARAGGAAEVLFLAVDLRDADSGERIRDAALQAFGAVDVLVNGVADNVAMQLFTETDPAAYSAGNRFHPEPSFLTEAVETVPVPKLAMLQRQGVIGRSVGRPEKVAAAVLYVASARAPFVTGQVMQVEGGVLL